MDIATAAEQYKGLDTVAVLESLKVVDGPVIEERDGIDNETKKPYNFFVVTVDGKEYRIPKIVLKQIRDLRKEDPSITHVSVISSGSGMATQYVTLAAR